MVHHGNAKERCSRILLHISECGEKQKAGEKLSRNKCPDIQTLSAVDTDCHIDKLKNTMNDY